jgi:hypothetical protein
MPLLIDGQVCLVPLVYLQTDNFRLFFHKQTDKQQTCPNRRRIGHVDVVVVSKCSHVWMGGEKEDIWSPAKD